MSNYSNGSFVNTRVENNNKHNSHLTIISDTAGEFSNPDKIKVTIEDKINNFTFYVVDKKAHASGNQLHITHFVENYPPKKKGGLDDGTPETGQLTVTITNTTSGTTTPVVVPVVYDDSTPTGKTGA